MKAQTNLSEHPKERKGMCHHSHELLVIIAMIGILIAVLLPIVAALKQGIRTGITFGEFLLLIGSGIFSGIVFILSIIAILGSVAIVIVTHELIKEKGILGTIQFCKTHILHLIRRN